MVSIYGKLIGQAHGCWLFRPALNEAASELGQLAHVPMSEASLGRREDLELDVVHLSADRAVELGLIPGAPSRRRRGVPAPETMGAFCIQ